MQHRNTDIKASFQHTAKIQKSLSSQLQHKEFKKIKHVILN